MLHGFVCTVTRTDRTKRRSLDKRDRNSRRAGASRWRGRVISLMAIPPISLTRDPRPDIDTGLERSRLGSVGGDDGLTIPQDLQIGARRTHDGR